MVNLVNVQEQVTKADEKDARKVVCAAEKVLVDVTRRVNFIESHGGMSVKDKLAALSDIAAGATEKKAPKALGGSSSDASDQVKERLANFANATNTDIDTAIALMLDVFAPIAELSQEQAQARVIIAGNVIAGAAGFEVEDGKLVIAKKHDALVEELAGTKSNLATVQGQFDDLQAKFGPIQEALEQNVPERFVDEALRDIVNFVEDADYKSSLSADSVAAKEALKDIATKVKPSRVPSAGDVIKVRVLDLKPETQEALENARPSDDS